MISRILITSLVAVAFLFSVEKIYWDLGVIINDNNAVVIQKEVELDDYSKNTSTYNRDNVKALHSNNFIPPILYELKNTGLTNTSVIKKYDDFIYSLSISETIHFFKKSFLKNQYSDFFSTHKLLRDNRTNDEIINSLYIQKLYQTSQFEKTSNTLKNIPINDLTDELLLYKIKTDIKLKNDNEALSNIQLFLDEFSDSDLLPYVTCEKRLLMNRNNEH